jgi:ABC-type transport system involved in multi-copper enzyme maturation permease subunit
MSPLVKKEIRLVLPAWIVAMLLAIVPAWVGGMAWNLDHSVNLAEAGFWLEGATPVIFALGLLLLGLTPFGQEFSQGTFTVLLSQPVDRSRVWRTKIFLVATAFLVVWLAAVISVWCQYYLYDHFHPTNSMHRLKYLYFNKNYEYFSVAFGHTVIFLALSVLVVFSGGLWTTLLLRQITNAFWFTLLTPLAIILGTMSFLSDRIASDQSVGRIIAIALAVYSVAGFCTAALLFRRCQDIQGVGGDVSFSGFKKFAGLGTTAHARTISFRPRHWFSALAWKEIQLHQVNILIAALLLLLHLASFITRKIHPHFSNPDLQAVLENIWILWLLMPILFGCSAIAEERRFGIMESQLSLPVSRRMQLFIKFSVALVLSLFLGATFPLLIEGTQMLNAWLFAIAAGLFFVSFYASSMARTVLQAMGLAIIAGVTIFFYDIKPALIVLQPDFFRYRFYDLYPGVFGFEWLRVCLGTAILLLVLAGLTYWNYKRLRQNNTLVRVNLLAMLVAFVAIPLLTYVIYFCAWENVARTRF